MYRSYRLLLLSGLLAAGLLTGCKPKAPVSTGGASAYFATPFQDESQFIVQAIATDLAEQVCYAGSFRLPDKKSFSVTVAETPESSLDSPVYAVRIRLAPGQREVKTEVSINGPIWSPAVYDSLTRELAQAVGLKHGNPGKPGDSELLSKLMDGSAGTIVEQNQAISAALEMAFLNPDLHEQAAMLLGAFMLRDWAGDFGESRLPLSRMTAHLALARFLRGSSAYGINGQMAEATLLTQVNDQALALERLQTIHTNDAAVAAMVRALRALNNGDYRELEQATNRCAVEDMAWFAARSYCSGTSSAWEKLSDESKQNITFIRIANCRGYSVEIGHTLLEAAIPLELQEISTVYNATHPKNLERSSLAEALNTVPERSFSEDGETVHVRVIGWGQWAHFLQRELCHAVEQNFQFMNRQWGVPDEAKEFARKCDAEFGTLRLYPFVRRFNCTDVKAYHKSVDDGFKVTVATPHLVPARCWNELCYKPSFAPLYTPNPNPHINEWHHHSPPPGTVYGLGPRMIQPSLVERPDVVAFFEKLHKLAPYDWDIANFLEVQKYQGHPTFDQAMALYGSLLPYSAGALRGVASAATNNPPQYEKLMLQAAALNYGCYYVLGDYFLDRNQEDKAAEYFDKAAAVDSDAVRIANYSRWRVWYYLKKNQIEKARQVADHAGEVYSFKGLEAKGNFLEATTNYDEAFDWFAKVEERYNDSRPLVNFCLRQMARTNDTRFAEAVQKRIKTLFPKGLEKVTLHDLHGPPIDGVLIMQENDALKAAGLKKGDVVVAIYGLRVHHMGQYIYGRQLKQTPEMELTVWQGDAYREFRPSPPNHRFGVDFGDYVAKPAKKGT